MGSSLGQEGPERRKQETRLQSKGSQRAGQDWTTGNALSINSVSHSVVADCEAPWTVVHQVRLSMEFFGQEYWTG